MVCCVVTWRVELTFGAPKGDFIGCGAGLACVGCVSLCLEGGV